MGLGRGAPGWQRLACLVRDMHGLHDHALFLARPRTRALCAGLLGLLGLLPGWLLQQLCSLHGSRPLPFCSLQEHIMLPPKLQDGCRACTEACCNLYLFASALP